VKDDGAMPKKYPKDQKDRAVRMLVERLDDYPSIYAARNAIGPPFFSRE